MGRYTGPKDRLSRREGVDLFGKGAKLTRLNVPPGVHGARGRSSPSQYGRQLREKQKVKRMYDIREKQFQGYIDRAFKIKGNTIDELFSLLETRLDNVVYRLGFAKTRNQARQFVSHRHVMINGKRVNVPSYQVKVGEAVTLSPKALTNPEISLILKKETQIPAWLTRRGPAGKVKREPRRDDVVETIEPQDIIEFYSR